MGKLTKGRSVLVITPFHYNGEDTHPGIVTRVWVECEPGDPAGSYINVTVLPDANLPFVATSVHLFDTREQAMARLAERTPWGGYTVTGSGTPPFPITVS